MLEHLARQLPEEREVEEAAVENQEGEAACEQELPMEASMEAEQKAEAKEQKKESPAHRRCLTAGSRFELASVNQDVDVSSTPLTFFSCVYVTSS